LDPAPQAPDRLPAAEFVWPTRPKFKDRVWRHVLLFVLTAITTTLVGAFHYVSFMSDFGAGGAQSSGPAAFLLHGLWYSGTVLAILGCHEMGHYLACRYYDVDASLPFFLPLPPPFPSGTLGAFIRIRELIPSKRMLFDIGIAGPIAGFLVTVPTLFLGLSMSRLSPLPTDDLTGFVSLGEPLLFKAAAWVFWGTAPDGYSINLHPMAFGAWFGLLATALNLIPIGQLDGGHIAYAVLGRRSSQVTLVMVGAALLLAYTSSSWVVWTILIIGMLFLFGRHHPRTFDEHEPLDRPRKVLALVALGILVVCFTPVPIEPLDLIQR
jgi:membrane-associated protease RseP (regulator of RpoE activity)